MSHLGRWLSALVDGELDDAERDRVLIHLAGCRSCLREANEMRALKRRLTALGETSAETAITDRLIEMARSDHESLDDQPRLPALWSTAPLLPGARRSPLTRQPALIRSWRTVTGTASSALLVIGFAAFMLGSSQAGRPAPKVTPAVDAYWLQHSFDSGQEPATTSGSGVPAGPASAGSPGPGTYQAGQSGGWTGTVLPARAGSAVPTLTTPGASPSPGVTSKSPSARPTRRNSG